MTADGVGAPGTAADSDRYGVPPPRPPDDGEAWYAPGTLDQRTVHPGVVTTVRERAGRLRYETRTPELSGTASGRWRGSASTSREPSYAGRSPARGLAN